MSTSATGSSTSAPQRTATAYVMLSRFALALIAVQFGLAGSAAFRGLDGKDTQDSWWAPHIMLGYGIALLTVVLLVLALVQKLGSAVVRSSVVVAVLSVILQPALAGLGDKAGAWIGGLHALNGVAIAAVLGIVSARLARTGG
ncbi:MAG TPA: DUF6220 domain-containing protein [Kineosporiaceae bacterium]|nr:DUF6220 domain-containing protein [Kineosporiaceae bacterium]